MEHQNLSFSKSQFETLLRSVAVTSRMYGVMGDMVDEKYKKRSDEIDEVERLLCGHVKAFGLEDVVDVFEEENVLDTESGWYQAIDDDAEAFEEFVLYDNLANELAWRDFHRAHDKYEIKKMMDECNGYLGVSLYDYEKRYRDEFDKYGCERLEIVEYKK